MQNKTANRARALSATGFVLVFAAIAVFRVAVTDQSRPQAADEPCHIAAGMEWLKRHTYRLDPVHPPLARYAIALPLYFAGEPYPDFLGADYNRIGNAILYDGGHYRRNLMLARVGMLPFLVLTTFLVFYWTQKQSGTVAAVVSTFLVSTLPSILAFAGVAYTDLPAACTQFFSLFAFSMWIEKATLRRSLLLGVSIGLAISAKLTSFLFLPSALFLMLLARWLVGGRSLAAPSLKRVQHVLMAGSVALLILWGSYLFSLGHLPTAGITEATPPLSSAAHTSANLKIPAPDFFAGVSEARLLNRSAPESYLFGHMRKGGWWYFFPLALALKMPLPFLILALTGICYSFWLARRGSWSALMPACALLGILIITVFVSYKVGTRHVLVALPLLSVLAGSGAVFLWQQQGKHRAVARAAVVLMLVWQGVASAQAQTDFLAYFNELAPRDASKALVKGCDLDCGQDLLRLQTELKSRGITRVSLGVWTSADVGEMGFPPANVLQPYAPVMGWVAVSVRSLRTGEVVFWQNKQFMSGSAHPQDALSWLEGYQPVAHIGRTILLYQIPERPIQKAKNE